MQLPPSNLLYNPHNLASTAAPMQAPPSSKETSTKSTTVARVAATSGPATAASEIRKNRKRKTTASDDFPGDQLPNPPTANQTTPSDNMATEEATEPTNRRTSGATLPPAPLPSFFEESTGIFPVSPSPNGSINQSHVDMLTALRDEAVTSTPCTNLDRNPPITPTRADPDQSLTTPTKSLKDRLLEAEERGGPLGNSRSNSRSPLDKYTKAPSEGMPPIHYAHPTAILDHLVVNLVGDWEMLLKGKLLAQPFGPDSRNAEKHPHLKALLFAAIVEITNSTDVSVCAPRAKANSYRTPFSFLIYNIMEQQVQTLKRRVWSSTAISFSVSTLNPSCPNYLFSIKGLTTMNDAEVRGTVSDVWQDLASLTFLHTITQTFPEDVREQKAHILQQFTHSLTVTRLDTKLRGNTIAPIFHIYAEGALIDNDNTWTQIRSYYASRTYSPQAQDPGVTVVAPFRCGICHAADHPRGLCPFPSVDGWNGPKRREIPGVNGGAGPGPGPDAQK